MTRRSLQVMAALTFVASGGLVFAQNPGAPQPPTKQTGPSTPAISLERPARLNPPVDHQMRAMEYHAKVRMILYPGRFAPTDLADAKSQLDAIAFKLNATGKPQNPILPFTAPSRTAPGRR